jgi:sec-independent protein translocase protein TatA
VGNLSPGELAILLVIALLVFGGKGLPEAGKAIGNGLREFRRALGEAQGAMRDPPPSGSGTGPGAADPPPRTRPRRLVE